MNGQGMGVGLQQDPLFQGLAGGSVDRLASATLARKYRKGAVIFSQGDIGDALYMVAEGRVRVSALDPVGHELYLGIAYPGDTFGEDALIDGLPRTTCATAVQASTVLVIRREPFLAQLKLDPTLALHFVRRLCNRLRRTTNLAEDAVLVPGPVRMAKRLERLLAHNGRPDASGAVELSISQDELAHFLGVSRQTVNEYLQAWHEEGWVDLGRGRIVCRDLAKLSRIAEGRDSPKDSPA